MDERIVRSMMAFEEKGVGPLKSGTLDVFSPEGCKSYRIVDGRIEGGPAFGLLQERKRPESS